VIDFAERLGVKLMPWQKWVLAHGLELRKDGTYRFRTVVILVSRQNGKTTLLAVLVLWRLLHDGARLCLSSSTNLDYAREAWEGAVEMAEGSDEVAPLFQWPPRRANGQQTFTTKTGARYKIASSNRRGGRSLSVDLGIADELREHATWDAWAALDGTLTARPDPQLWALSNAGDDTSVVLNHLRDQAVGAIETGVGDDSLALFEYSASDDCDLDDRAAWAQANPALGVTITERTLEGKAAKLPAPVFRTEHLCQRVAALDPAVPADAWVGCEDPSSTLARLRDRVACCLDVSPDLAHVTLAAAAVGGDGLTRVELVAAWESTDAARRDLPELLARVKPRVLGWFPGGPAAALAAELKGRRGAQELTAAEVPAVCQGFAEQVIARRVRHAMDPLLTTQVGAVSKLAVGDGWRFTRRGAGHCDAAYAAAGATHLARSFPPPPRAVVIVGRRAG
jgi:Phage Terminase